MSADIVTRPAGVDDLDALLVNVAAGFASYTSFNPPGWTPPDPHAGRERMADLLADPDIWALLAMVDDVPVGHVAFMPARERTPGEPSGAWMSRTVIPGLAHFWQLFVLPEWWGRGVAALLHDAAVAEMRARGYLSARLFTPSGHIRARRFYERRGWRAGDEEWNQGFAFMMSEYRLALDRASPSASPDADYASGSHPAR